MIINIEGLKKEGYIVDLEKDGKGRVESIHIHPIEPYNLKLHQLNEQLHGIGLEHKQIEMLTYGLIEDAHTQAIVNAINRSTGE